jgi:hypothetical protein
VRITKTYAREKPDGPPTFRGVTINGSLFAGPDEPAAAALLEHLNAVEADNRTLRTALGAARATAARAVAGELAAGQAIGSIQDLLSDALGNA